MKNLKENVRKKILEYIDKNLKNGIDLYTDYRDAFEPQTALVLMHSDNPWEAFYEKMDYIFEDYAYDEKTKAYQDMMEEIKDELKKEGEEKVNEFWEENDTEFNDLFMSEVNVNIPYDHYLDEVHDCSILIDNGDSNYDFSINPFLKIDEKIKEYLKPENKNTHVDGYDDSSALWLAETQGYPHRKTAEMLLKHRKEYLTWDENIDNYKDKSFLGTLCQEFNEDTWYTNTVVFLVTLTLRDILNIGSIHKQNNPENKKKYEIKINKDTMCGLFDEDNGTGGTLDIRLEKNLIIPDDKVFEIQIVGADNRGYTPDETYGLGDEAYTEAKVELK